MTVALKLDGTHGPEPLAPSDRSASHAPEIDARPDAPGGGRSVLILGATSDIARATAEAFAVTGARLLLAARDIVVTRRLAADLAHRYGVDAKAFHIDVLDPDAHTRLLGDLNDLGDLPDVVVCAVGMMGSQHESEADPDLTREIVRSNFEGPVCVIGHLAQAFETRGYGTIIALSSVAGDRGRSVNYVYGSAKSGLTTYLSGLRSRLHGTGVRVVTVKPGYVDTRMIEGMDTPAVLTAEATEVGKVIERASHNHRDVIYVRPIWRLVMLVLRNIPEPIFKRLSF